MNRRSLILRSVFVLLVLGCVGSLAWAWEREPLSVFGERRAKLVSAVNAPPVKH